MSDPVFVGPLFDPLSCLVTQMTSAHEKTDLRGSVFSCFIGDLQGRGLVGKDDGRGLAHIIGTAHDGPVGARAAQGHKVAATGQR